MQFRQIETSIYNRVILIKTSKKRTGLIFFKAQGVHLKLLQRVNSNTDADIFLPVVFSSGIFTTSLIIFPIPMGRLFNRRLAG
jgi:hypothetical protein